MGEHLLTLLQNLEPFAGSDSFRDAAEPTEDLHLLTQASWRCGDLFIPALCGASRLLHVKESFARVQGLRLPRLFTYTASAVVFVSICTGCTHSFCIMGEAHPALQERPAFMSDSTACNVRDVCSGDSYLAFVCWACSTHVLLFDSCLGIQPALFRLIAASVHSPFAHEVLTARSCTRSR